VAEITSRLEAASLAERREVAKYYTPTALRVVGTPNPEAKKVVSDVAKRLKGASADEVVGLAEALVHEGSMEARYVAYLLLVRHKPAFASLTPKRIEGLGAGNDNWASVDAYACTLTGKAWLEGLLSDALLRRWARSKDRWWRRTALVSTVPLNRIKQGAPGDTERTLMMCDLLKQDHDDMIVKAMSWALRSLSQHDAAAVRRYVKDNEAVLHKRVLREVRRKLDTGKKN
jgi:3-methyladenine DNA glycosylase AlkD